MGIGANKLDVTMLGEPLIVQVFERDLSDRGSLVYDSRIKYVGVLQAYSVSDTHVTVSLKGLRQVEFNLETHYVELFKVNFFDE